MASKKKTRIQTLVVGFVVFLTLNYVYVMGQQPRGEGEESAQEDLEIVRGTHLYNQVLGVFDHTEESVFNVEKPSEPLDLTDDLPRIVSVRLVNDDDKYIMEVEAVDRDANSLRIEVQHEGGKPDRITFSDSDVLTIDDRATFISEPFSLEPGSHVFMIAVRDPHHKTCKMSVTFDVPRPAAEQPENQPPQILSIEHKSKQGMQNYYIMAVEIKDEDPGSVRVEIEGNPIQFNRDGTIFISQPFHLPPGLNQLTIIAQDSHGQQDRMQITIDISGDLVQQIEGNLPPKISSIKYSSDQGNYTIELNIEDEDPSSLQVSTKGKIEIKFEEKPNSRQDIRQGIKQSTFTSDPFSLDPGSRTLTITVSDARNETEMQTVIDVPQPARNYLLMSLLLAVALVVVVVKLAADWSSRRTSRPSDIFNGETDFMTSRYKTDIYGRETAALERKSSDMEFQMKLEEDIQKVVGQEEIDDLNEIASENSPEREDISALLLYISKALCNLTSLNVSNAGDEIKNGIRRYKSFKTYLSQDEEEALSKAKDAYNEALAELRRAHGALDVKILELFLKRAYELTSGQTIYGKKIQNYEASKKLSETVMSLLGDPELRVRLRKLREMGYMDSIELS